MIKVEGRQIADKILAELRAEVSQLKNKPRLAAVLIGDNIEFKKFVELKGRVAESVGIIFNMYQFPETITTEDLSGEILKISENSDGALIELPLPGHINQQEILNIVSPKKDVDVLSEEAQELFYGNKSRIYPPAVEASKIVFEEYGVNLAGKTAAVFGQGILVGKPVSHWLEQRSE